MSVATGEVGSDRASFTVEFVAGGAEGGVGRFTFRRIGCGDDLGGEQRLPIRDLRL